MRLYIDPAYGKPIAFSCWDSDINKNGVILSWGSTIDINDLYDKICESFTVYCEDQFGGVSWESMKKLIRSAGWVEALTILAKKDFRLINPRSWQSYYGLTRRNLTKRMKTEIKRNAINDIAIKQDIPLNLKLNDDVKDAILMGRYVEWCLSAEKYGL